MTADPQRQHRRRERQVLQGILAAIELHTRDKIGFWDAMIVVAAAESGCDVLWMEDLNDGQLLRGVRVRSPFSAPPGVHSS